MNAVTWVSPEPPVLIQAPNTVEATYWELDSGGYLVHILNHTYDAVFPAPPSATKVPASREVFRGITEVIPVRDIVVRLNGRPVAIKILVGDSYVTIDEASAVIAQLNEYAVVLISGSTNSPPR